MKKTLIAISAACLGALSVLADDAATPYARLKFGTNDWFSVSAGQSGNVVAGGELVVGTGNTFTQTGFEATNPDLPITFTSTNATADTTFRTVTIVTKASTVPAGMDMAGSGKIAVSLREVGTATNFYAKIGAEWIQLTGGAVPEEGADYTLVIRFDDRNEGKKVQFATVIDSTESVLTGTGATGGWFDYSASTVIQSDLVHVGLLGKGGQTGFDGVVLNIVAEVVPTGDGAIEIKEEDKKAFEAAIKGTSYDSVSAYLQAPVREAIGFAATRAATGVTVAQAYALGLVKTENGEVVAVNGGAFEAKAGAVVTTGDNAGIKLEFIGITPHPETVEKIEYVLLGSKTGTDWSDEAVEIGTFNSADAIKIPTSDLSTYHFFKVNAKVTFKPNQQ